MARKKRVIPATREETRDWLYKSVRSAPRPLPAGRFPLLMRQAEAEGYCRLIDPITQDIEMTPEGRLFFY